MIIDIIPILCANAIRTDRLISFVLVLYVQSENIITTTLYTHMCALVRNNCEATSLKKNRKIHRANAFLIRCSVYQRRRLTLG